MEDATEDKSISADEIQRKRVENADETTEAVLKYLHEHLTGLNLKKEKN